MWRALTRNLGWKLLALLVSVVLWLAIEGAPALVTTHAVPILYRNLPPDLMIGQDAPDSARVELRGSARRLTGENLADLAIVLDLSGIRGPGERAFTLSDSNLDLPKGVTFLRIAPSQLRVRFSRLLVKDIPVEIRIAAPPPPGYRVVRQQVTPDQLRIAGPEPRVLLARAAETGAIDLSGATGTRDCRATAFVNDPQIRFDSSPVVTVTIAIEKDPAQP